MYSYLFDSFSEKRRYQKQRFSYMNLLGLKVYLFQW